MAVVDLLLRRLPHDPSPARLACLAALLLLLLLALVVSLLGPFPALLAASAAFAFTLRWVFWHGEGVFGWRWRWLHASAATTNALSSEPKRPGSLRVVCLSDTHGRHRRINWIPEGDVLVHCGDFTHQGTHAEVADFNAWLGTLPHRHKLVVAGNHDFCLDAAEYEAHWQKEFGHRQFDDPHASRALLSNATYLDGRSVVIDGVKFFGSPMTPPIPGRTMAFNVPRGFAAQQHWAKMPADVDVLITHGPPNGVLDKTFTGLRVGDEALLKEVVSRVRPQFHVFGHIHEAYGATRIGKTAFVNCATSTLLGSLKHPPVVIDVPAKC